ERPTHNNHRIITTGTGTVALAEFASNPSGSSSYGTDRYTTAVVLPGSSFSSVIVMNCVLNGGNQLRWWDGTGWVPATPQIRNPIPCQLFTATSTSTPTLAQLDGAPFAVTNSTLEVQVPAAQSVQYGSPFSADVSATGADVGATITLQAS